MFDALVVFPSYETSSLVFYMHSVGVSHSPSVVAKIKAMRATHEMVRLGASFSIDDVLFHVVQTLEIVAETKLPYRLLFVFQTKEMNIELQPTTCWRNTQAWSRESQIQEPHQ